MLPIKLDLVCRKRAVSNSRPACRKDFFLFTCRTIEEIGNGNIRTKIEVYSITRFVDRFQNSEYATVYKGHVTKTVPLLLIFIRVFWRNCPCASVCLCQFEVCSYTRFRDTSEGLPHFIDARDPIKATPRYRILFVPFGEIVRMYPMPHFKSVAIINSI